MNATDDKSAAIGGHIPDERVDLAFDDQPIEVLMGAAEPRPPTPADAIALWQTDPARSPVTAAAVASILGRRGIGAADLAGVEGIEQVLRAALERGGDDASNAALRRASLLAALGALLSRLGRCAEAEPLLREAVAVQRERLGRIHVETLASTSALADLLESCHRANEAEALRLVIRMECLVEAEQKTLGSKAPNFGRTLNNSAYELRKAGLAAEAEPFDRRAAALSETVFYKAHPLAIHRRNNLSLTLVMLGKFDEAADILEENTCREFAPLENLTPRLPYLLATLKFVSGNGAMAAQHFEVLKAHFAKPPLPVDESIQVPWDLRYYLDALAPQLPSGIHGLLVSLLDLLNARCQSPLPEDLPARLAALDSFPAFRDAQPAMPE